MEHNYTKLAKELRTRIESSVWEPIVEVSKINGKQADGIWVTSKDGESIGRFLEIADFCRYHDLSVYVTQRFDAETNYKQTTAVRIF